MTFLSGEMTENKSNEDSERRVIKMCLILSNVFAIKIFPNKAQLMTISITERCPLEILVQIFNRCH